MKLKTGEISRGTREIKKCHGGLGQVGASSEGRRKRGRCSFFFLLLLTGDDSHGISMKPISKSFPMDKGLKNQDSGKNQRFNAIIKCAVKILSHLYLAVLFTFFKN